MTASTEPRAGAAACPADELLAAFAAGELGAEGREAVEEHIAGCRTCRIVIAAAADDETSATLHASEVRASMKPLTDILTVARSGEVLGKWRLVELLGAGGMGQVYAAEHVESGRRVAIKILRPELSVDPSIVRRFVREPYTANRIDHPAFVHVVDDGTTPWGAPYFAMDLIDSPTLRAVVRKHGPIAEERVRRVGARILEAVAAAHDAGVLHRDLKPDNITLKDDDGVRILDLGIARLDRRDDSHGPAEHTTATGQMLGTPTYMPPEQARAIRSEIDERADVYAVGATLFFMATGTAVRSGDAALFEAMTKPVPPVRTFAPELSPAFANVLDRALAFDRNDRYASALEMRDALLANESETSKPGAPRRRQGAILAALAFGSVVIALVAVGYRPETSDAEQRASPSPAAAENASAKHAAVDLVPAASPSPSSSPPSPQADVPTAAPVARTSSPSAVPTSAPSVRDARTPPPRAPASPSAAPHAPAVSSSPPAAPPVAASSAPVLPKDMAENPYR